MKASVALLLLFLSTTTYGMGYIRAAISNLPPVVITNAPPPAPEPLPTSEPVPPVVTPPQPPPSSGAVLSSCAWGRFPMVNLKYTGTDGWPTKQAANGKTLKGLMFLNGKKVEWFKPGQTAISVVNALEVGGKYYQAIPSGATVTISIADINGKNESNRMTLVWP